MPRDFPCILVHSPPCLWWGRLVGGCTNKPHHCSLHCMCVMSVHVFVYDVCTLCLRVFGVMYMSMLWVCIITVPTIPSPTMYTHHHTGANESTHVLACANTTHGPAWTAACSPHSAPPPTPPRHSNTPIITTAPHAHGRRGYTAATTLYGMWQVVFQTPLG